MIASGLRRLPLHAIKVDRSFVQAMTTDADDAAIVRSTIDLAHNLGLEVIAEGVSTQDIYDELRTLPDTLEGGEHGGEKIPEFLTATPR